MNVCQRHQEVAKEANTGSAKTGRILGPHGRRLQETDHQKRGHHNGKRGVRHSHVCCGMTHRWRFAEQCSLKICGDSDTGRGVHGIDGDKVIGGNPHDFNAETALADILPETPTPHAAYLTQQQQPLPRNPSDNINIPSQ